MLDESDLGPLGYLLVSLILGTLIAILIVVLVLDSRIDSVKEYIDALKNCNQQIVWNLSKEIWECK